jgi:hypothetical protein
VMSSNYPAFTREGEFISIDCLISSINAAPEIGSQRAICEKSAGQANAKFIRNPRFVDPLLGVVDVDRLILELGQIELEKRGKAYRKCNPDWANEATFPQQPRAMLLAITQLPRGVETKLPEFIDCLIKDRSFSIEKRQSLEAWGSGKYRAEPMLAAMQAEHQLMICVKHEGFDKYGLSVSFGDENPSSSDNGSTTLPAPLNAVGIDQIPQIVSELVLSCYEEGIPLSQLSVQCFLPKKLLNMPIEQQDIELNGSFRSLGTACKEVVLRSSDRRVVDGNWKERWKQFVACCDRSVCRDGLVWHQGDDDRFYADLSNQTKVGCCFVALSDVSKNIYLVDEFLCWGMPIALWVRPDHGVDNPSGILEKFNEVALEKLPGILMTERRRAGRIDATDETRLVQHIALLWDNPNQPFPIIIYDPPT